MTLDAKIFAGAVGFLAGLLVSESILGLEGFIMLAIAVSIAGFVYGAMEPMLIAFDRWSKGE